MYGNNEQEPFPREHDGMVLNIKEIFETLQGEGPYTGRPATFVRLGGCHLRCWFCDTAFEDGRVDMPVEAVVARVNDAGHLLAVLTGGEPMRQNLVPLCRGLLAKRIDVQIETAGSFWPVERMQRMWFEEMVLQERIHIVVSPKAGYVHSRALEIAQSWKYVVTMQDPMDKNDGLPVLGMQWNTRDKIDKVCRPPQRILPHNIYLQPCDQGHSQKEIQDKCVALCKEFGYRLSLQTHKILGLP